MGGECNYLLRVTPDAKRLDFVDESKWKTPTMKAWKEEVRGSRGEGELVRTGAGVRGGASGMVGDGSGSGRGRGWKR